jgi:hypothetical protein
MATFGHENHKEIQVRYLCLEADYLAVLISVLSAEINLTSRRSFGKKKLAPPSAASISSLTIWPYIAHEEPQHFALALTALSIPTCDELNDLNPVLQPCITPLKAVVDSHEIWRRCHRY